MKDLRDAVARSLAPETREEFDRRVDEQAATLIEDIRSGALDNEDFSLGLELEVYATDAEGRLVRVPEAVFEVCGPELGRHNAELNTDPTRFDEAGIETKATALRERLERARALAAGHDHQLVLDAMWTIPPEEGSLSYLSTVEKRDGISLAANMHPNARYCALDNDVLARTGSVELDLPGISHTFPSVLFESLASSLQPHLLVPEISAFSRYHNAAIRTMGPLLALATNSPFLPADLYTTDDPLETIKATPHECRIPAFERSMNVGDDRKVGVPHDIERPEEIVERIVADRTTAPFLREWVTDEPEQYHERFFEFGHKRGVHWRWVRAVIGGTPVDGVCDGRSMRIEYRPLPTQPTLTDTISLWCLTVGLLRGVVATDHPLVDLDWRTAERCFYDVVKRGLDADLAWVTADGHHTVDGDEIYDEVFSLARRGLREQGLTERRTNEWLAPMAARREQWATPSEWKKTRVREHVENDVALAEAICAMQREYDRHSQSGEPFVEWPPSL